MIDPAGHRMHATSLAALGITANFPAAQFMQAVTLDAMLNFPAAHAVQVVAPPSGPWFVMDPAGQSTQ